MVINVNQLQNGPISGQTGQGLAADKNDSNKARSGANLNKGSQAAQKLAASENLLKPKPLKLEGLGLREFQLEGALEEALTKAVSFLNQTLGRENLEMRLKNTVEQGLHTAVTDLNNGNEIRTYEAREVLKLYSSQNLANSVVIDGKI